MVAPANSTSVRVAVAGGVIVGSRAGSGPPVLLLHGGPGMGDYTDELAAELAMDFEVVRYQQRGIAPSVETGPHTVEANVADAIAVLDEVGLGRFWLVGHSWGGHLAMHVAVVAPERVRGLVCINARGAVPDGGIDLMRAELRKRYEALYGRPAGAFGIEEGWPLRFANPREAPPFPDIPVSSDVLTELHRSVDQHYARQTLVRGLPRFTGPALFIHGDLDPLPPSVSEQSASLIPGAEVRIIENCGHFPWIEYPGAVRLLVVNFVQSQ